MTRVERHDYVPYERMFIKEEYLAVERASMSIGSNNNDFGIGMQASHGMNKNQVYSANEKHGMILADMSRYAVCVFYGICFNYLYSVFFLYQLWHVAEKSGNSVKLSSIFWLILAILGDFNCFICCVIIWFSWKFSFAMKFYFKCCCFCQRSCRLCCECLALKRREGNTVSIVMLGNVNASNTNKRDNYNYGGVNSNKKGRNKHKNKKKNKNEMNRKDSVPDAKTPLNTYNSKLRISQLVSNEDWML